MSVFRRPLKVVHIIEKLRRIFCGMEMLEGHANLFGWHTICFRKDNGTLGIGNLLVMIRLLSVNGYEDFSRESTLSS